MARWLAVLTVALLLMSPARAEEPVPCVAMVGDFWTDSAPPDNVRTIDGTAVKSTEELVRAVGTGAVVQGGNFTDWDFRKVRLTNACFVEADFTGSVWKGAETPGIGFIKSELAESDLSGIKAPGVLFRDVGLGNVKADRADFSHGRFEGGWFSGTIDGWNIDEANLTGFVFDCGITLSDGCPLDSGGKPISARGANFTRAKISSFRRYGLLDVDLTGAKLDRTELSPGQFANLREVAIAHPIILVGGDARLELTAEEALALLNDSVAFVRSVAGPSFDCTRAASDVEKLLCSDTAGDLADLDRQLADLFVQLRGQQPALVNEQRQWLKERDRCMGSDYASECLRTAYSARVGALIGMIGERDWLARGQAALFIEDDLPLSDAMRASALFARIAPVLASGSLSHVHVSRNPDGSYAASGQAIGANAHSCTVEATTMRLDTTTGWYAVFATGTPRPARILQIHGDRLQVIDSGHPARDIPEADMDYVSCGARASFGPLRRIELPDALLQSYAGQDGQE